MKAMVLAAGLGTRLRPVTDHYAKPAIPFLNLPLLYYSVGLLTEAGATDFVFNSHHQSEQIARLVSHIQSSGGPSIICHEAAAPLDSGGGIRNARSSLDVENFLVANGDEVILPRNLNVLSQLRSEHNSSGALATILVMRHPLVGTQFGGVWANAAGDVQGFGKDPQAYPQCTGFHYIGLQVLNSRVFNYLPKGKSNILYDGLTAAIAAGEKVRIVEGDFTWFETGNRHDFLCATRDCLKILKNEELASGDDRAFLLKLFNRFWEPGRESLLCGARSAISPSSAEPGLFLLSGNEVIVEPGAIMRGFVVLGDKTHVHARALIENSVLLPGTRLTGEAVVREQIVTPWTV